MFLIPATAFALFLKSYSLGLFEDLLAGVRGFSLNRMKTNKQITVLRKASKIRRLSICCLASA